MSQWIVNFTGANAILQSILLSLFFFVHKKGIRISNRILAFLILTFGILIFSTMPGASYKFMGYYKVAFLLRRFGFLIAPLFFFYVQSAVNFKFQWQWKYALHFIPFIFLLTLSAYQGFINGIWYLPNAEEYYLHTSFLVLQNAIYLALVMRFLKQNQMSLRSFFFKENDDQFKWLRFFIVVYSIFWIFNFHNFILFKLFNLFKWCPYASSINCLIPFLLLNGTTLVALIKPEVFSRRGREGSQPLDDAMADRFRKKLVDRMEIEKAYRIADLSMGDLARDLRISPKYLSYVLNNKLDCNFYDFINKYRIEESKQLLANGSNDYRKTILEIAYEVGFNSKSTFNMAFKKQMGMTPSEFRNQLPDSRLSKVSAY